MVYRTALLKLQGVKSLEGSNPSLSARVESELDRSLFVLSRWFVQFESNNFQLFANSNRTTGVLINNRSRFKKPIFS